MNGTPTTTNPTTEKPTATAMVTGTDTVTVMDIIPMKNPDVSTKASAGPASSEHWKKRSERTVISGWWLVDGDWRLVDG